MVIMGQSILIFNYSAPLRNAAAMNHFECFVGKLKRRPRDEAEPFSTKAVKMVQISALLKRC